MKSIRQAFLDKYLDPSESLGEVLFGLIMVLTFTLGAGLATVDDREATRELLIAALGCNLAWGIIDCVMYVMTALFERSRTARLARRVRSARDDEHAIAMIAGELEEHLAGVSSAAARRTLYDDVATTVRNAEPTRTSITRDDIVGGIASFLLVFTTALPAVVPFLIIDDSVHALRASNTLLIGMLFLAGYQWGRETNARPWITGLTIMLFGAVLVFVAIQLGG